MMTKVNFVGAVLRAAVAIGIASGGITAATAHQASTMGGMQMAPGSKMDMKGKPMDMKGMKMPAKKPMHHKHAMHKKSAAK
jgi:hypothetical protein